MRAFWLLSVCCLFGLPHCSAQSHTIDSLKNKVEVATGKNRVDALNDYAYALMSYDVDRSKAVSEEAYQLGQKLNYQKGIAIALTNKGIIEYSLGNDTLAKITFQKAGKYFEEIDEKGFKGRTLVWLGYINQSLGRLDSASFYYDRSYQLLKDSTNPSHLSFLYLHLADFQKIKNDPVKQLNYLQRCWTIRTLLNNKFSLVWCGASLAAYYTEHGSYQKALSYLDLVEKKLGKDTLNNEEFIIICKQRGAALTNLGEHKKAIGLFSKVKRFYEHNPFPLDQVRVLIEIGYVQAEVSNFETSLKYYFEALKICDQKSFRLEKTLLYFRIGWVYYVVRQNSLSGRYANKTLKSATQNNQNFERASALNLLGLLADRLNKSEAAFKYFKEALALREKNNERIGISSTLLNLGIHFENLGQYALAEDYELKSLTLEEKLDHAIGICYACQSLGQLYVKSKKLDKAHFYLNKAEVLAKRIQAEDVVLDIYRNKRDLYTSLKAYPAALQYALLYEHLRDSIFNVGLSNRIITLQHDYELDKLDDEIALLTKDRQLQQIKLTVQEQEISEQRLIIIVVTVLLILISGGTYAVLRFYRKVRQLNREVSEQNEEISAQSEELREANDVLGKLNREISEQKEEIQAQAEELRESNEAISEANLRLEEKVKARTSELKEAYTELDTFFYRSSHDFRRPLTTFMGLAEVAKIMVKDSAALELFEKVNETARSLDKMLSKLQSISVAGGQELIYSEVMMEQIFQIELDNFKEEIIQKSIRVSVEVKLGLPFLSYPALVKFIAQNLLENAIAFCAAEGALISIKAYENKGDVVIEVADNGQGIDWAYLPRVFEMYFRANDRSKGNGLGLYIVKKMVEKLNGRVELKSEVFKGTTVLVFIPNNFIQ